MGQTNGQTAKGKQMQRRDQRQCIDMQSWSLLGLQTLIAGGGNCATRGRL